MPRLARTGTGAVAWGRKFACERADGAWVRGVAARFVKGGGGVRRW